jgi:hypothetical protein
MRIRENQQQEMPSEMRFDMVKINQFQEDDVESDGSEEFLRGLGFKDPFHRELLSTEGTDQEGS